MTFFEKLDSVCREKETLLCIGLDPRVKAKGSGAAMKEIVEQNRRIIEETLPYAACFKPNIAFYEVYGPEGLMALKETLSLIPREIPVLIDAKRNDIGSTAQAYADSLLDFYKADAVTLSPYMGRDAVDPFLNKGDEHGVFLLCRTTNPGAGAIQDLQVQRSGGEHEDLYISTARECISWGSQVGLVVAGTDTVALKKVRAVCPDTWFLTPGIGAQGGDMLEAVSAGCRADGLGILPNVSRSVAEAKEPGKAAKEYRDKLNDARAKRVSVSGLSLKGIRKDKIMKGLIKTECFRIGEFILKSGKKSPFYIDLRRVSSDASLLAEVARGYAELMKGLDFDRIAGIPIAALPLATAVSLETGIPMIYPRMTMKEHGTGNRIEGEYKKGEKILLLDDLITTGKSKVEAIEILRDAGLVVEDLLVLLERGVQGRKDMEAAGINLHSYAHVKEFLQPCRDLNMIDDVQLKDMLDFAGKE
ncbi:orotidine-5'-phosphate decarboxylase [Oceanispirochaeta crateris]|uniref:Orotate phosphoribosyltransferase n=1 Tax=Oceanispirochaeta crateris TaxID=2518645 RepID=A0A5C1QJF5_9SPIO|nr:orotidine-5'-phosphate decarboxylase [Oceanispirochaeta crateris]QEN07130.1 orotidine-5'-phosphate decarboxylase [Oceanispirochaeta crateris]